MSEGRSMVGVCFGNHSPVEMGVWGGSPSNTVLPGHGGWGVGGILWVEGTGRG